MPGPAFCAATAVSTKMPVPMMAPMPSMVSWNAPSWRLSDLLLGGLENLVEWFDALEQHCVLPMSDGNEAASLRRSARGAHRRPPRRRTGTISDTAMGGKRHATHWSPT